MLKRGVPFRRGVSSSKPNLAGRPHSPSFKLPSAFEFEILAAITESLGLPITLKGKGIPWLRQTQEAAYTTCLDV